MTNFLEMKQRMLQKDQPPVGNFRQMRTLRSIPDGWRNVDLPNSQGGRIYVNDAFPGEKFFSATNVLGKISSMRGEGGWLEEWRKRVGNEEADRITEESRLRGSEMHLCLERYLDNQEAVCDHRGGKILFDKLRPYLDERIGAVVASEAAMASRLLRIAGRVDLVAFLDGDEESGVETLVDFKSSRRDKGRQDIHGYARQIWIYAALFQETTGVKIELGEIWMSVWNEGSPFAKKFEFTFSDYGETVIDEIADFWDEIGDPIDRDRCKRLFIDGKET